MHPPLHRPHPDCQAAIAALEHCQKNRHWLNVFACNKVKSELDQCFRREKQGMLKRVNEGWAEQEEETMRAMGLLSWEEHCRREREKSEKSQNATN
mmetsp:Transcript_18805/g.24419  ORF Transcript_18805/g.24419 Transcript_18805/m.24419 type:complete len:96 (-) Transcript_18805:180-467(-)